MALLGSVSRQQPGSVTLQILLVFAFLALCAMYVPAALMALTALTGACWLAVLVFDPRHTMRERITGGLVPLAPAFVEALVRVVGPERAAIVTLVVAGVVALAVRRMGERARTLWETALSPIGWTALSACLTLFFLLVLTPFASVWRRVARRPILAGIDRTRETYWEPRPPPAPRHRASRLY
jgi:hypothetical protein